MKQNIAMWLKGTQKIPKKYLPILAEKFNVSEEFLQSEVPPEKIELINSQK